MLYIEFFSPQSRATPEQQTKRPPCVAIDVWMPHHARKSKEKPSPASVGGMGLTRWLFAVHVATKAVVASSLLSFASRLIPSPNGKNAYVHASARIPRTPTRCRHYSPAATAATGGLRKLFSDCSCYTPRARQSIPSNPKTVSCHGTLRCKTGVVERNAGGKRSKVHYMARRPNTLNPPTPLTLASLYHRPLTTADWMSSSMNAYIATATTRLHRTSLLNATNVLRKMSVTHGCDTSRRYCHDTKKETHRKHPSKSEKHRPRPPSRGARTAATTTCFARPRQKPQPTALLTPDRGGAQPVVPCTRTTTLTGAAPAHATVPSSRLRAATKVSCLPLVARGHIIT